jgi:hypothetical protein
MIVMPSNWSAGLVHYLAGIYPGMIGHLYSPKGQRGPYPWLPYALDNGAFKNFDKYAWVKLLRWSQATSHYGQRVRIA